LKEACEYTMKAGPSRATRRLHIGEELPIREVLRKKVRSTYRNRPLSDTFRTGNHHEPWQPLFRVHPQHLDDLLSFTIPAHYPSRSHPQLTQRRKISHNTRTGRATVHLAPRDRQGLPAMAQNLLMGLAQLHARINPELISKKPRNFTEGMKRVRLTSTRVQGAHTLNPELLPKWIRLNQRQKLLNHLCVAPQPHLNLVAKLARLQVTLYQTGDLSSTERVRINISERRNRPPQCQRLVEARRCLNQIPTSLACTAAATNKSNRCKSSRSDGTSIRYPPGSV
jgi:hypothetical protein